MIYILLTVFVLGPINAMTVRAFLRQQAGMGWWVSLAIAWLVGAAAGFWSGVYYEYQPSPTLRVFGAPVPHAYFHLEGPPGEEKWMDYITEAPVFFAGSNVFIMAVVAACPIGLIYAIRCLIGRRSSTLKPSGAS